MKNICNFPVLFLLLFALLCLKPYAQDNSEMQNYIKRLKIIGDKLGINSNDSDLHSLVDILDQLD